jgi:hypothetical protein
MVRAANAAPGDEPMKRLTRERKNPASARASVKELTPLPDPPAGGSTRRVIMHVGGKRFELTCRIEVRAIPREPAKVIEMPGPAMSVDCSPLAEPGMS